MSSNTIANNQQPNHYANSVSNSVISARNTVARAPRKMPARVVENREHSDGNKIKVVPIELLPLIKGHLKDNPVPMSKTYKDARGKSYKAIGMHNNNITAEYWSNDSFRKSPPDVQRDEIVMIWQSETGDNWYWEETLKDASTKRRKETVIQTINADKRTGPDPDTHDSTNTYYQEMSSHNKTWTVSTSKKDGEFAAYLIQINAGGGSVIIKDDLGNFIELNSRDKKIQIRNELQTEVCLDKNDIFVHCNEHYTEEVGNSQSIQIGNNKDEKIGNNFNLHVSGNINIQVGGNANIQVSGNTKLECGNTEITGNVNIGGNTNISGTLAVNGAASLGGGGSVKGALSATGPVSFPNGGNSIAAYRHV